MTSDLTCWFVFLAVSLYVYILINHSRDIKMILVIISAVNLGQLWHKAYIGWWSNKFVKHCIYIIYIYSIYTYMHTYIITYIPPINKLFLIIIIILFNPMIHLHKLPVQEKTIIKMCHKHIYTWISHVPYHLMGFYLVNRVANLNNH